MKPDRWKKISRIYHAALEVTDKDRTSFLEEACRGDTGLHREVESLLGSATKTNSFTIPGPMSTLRPMSPPLLDRVVKRCLAKDPDGRWQSARDLMLELKWIVETGLLADQPGTVVRRFGTREKLAWGLALLILLGSLSASFFVSRYFRSGTVTG